MYKDTIPFRIGKNCFTVKCSQRIRYMAWKMFHLSLLLEKKKRLTFIRFFLLLLLLYILAHSHHYTGIQCVGFETARRENRSKTYTQRILSWRSKTLFCPGSNLHKS